MTPCREGAVAFFWANCKISAKTHLNCILVGRARSLIRLRNIIRGFRMKQIQSLAYIYAVSSCSTCKEWPHKKYIKISILYLTDFLKVTKAVYIKNQSWNMSHDVFRQYPPSWAVLSVRKKSCVVFNKPPPVKMIDRNKISWRISKRCCALQEIWIYHFVTYYLCKNLCNVSYWFTLEMKGLSKKVESILIRNGWFKALRKIWRKVSVLDYLLKQAGAKSTF